MTSHCNCDACRRLANKCMSILSLFDLLPPVPVPVPKEEPELTPELTADLTSEFNRIQLCCEEEFKKVASCSSRLHGIPIRIEDGECTAFYFGRGVQIPSGFKFLVYVDDDRCVKVRVDKLSWHGGVSVSINKERSHFAGEPAPGSDVIVETLVRAMETSISTRLPDINVYGESWRDAEKLRSNTCTLRWI